jgi:hypothetical protein
MRFDLLLAVEVELKFDKRSKEMSVLAHRRNSIAPTVSTPPCAMMTFQVPTTSFRAPNTVKLAIFKGIE